MPGFEKFHPVLTKHFRLDWLTASPVKNTDQLLNKATLKTKDYDDIKPSTVLATVDLVSGIMRQVMNSKQLTWGITDSHNRLVGIISILNLDELNTVGQISFVVIDQTILQEVLPRVIAFSQNHFPLTKLTIAIHEQKLKSLFESIGFKAVNESRFEILVKDFTYLP